MSLYFKDGREVEIGVGKGRTKGDKRQRPRRRKRHRYRPRRNGNERGVDKVFSQDEAQHQWNAVSDTRRSERA
jgi:hypothetical protein